MFVCHLHVFLLGLRIWKITSPHFFLFQSGKLCYLLQVALDYIGKRGATVGVTREKRIKYVLENCLSLIQVMPSFSTWIACENVFSSTYRYAKEILQKEMLPHVGVGEYCETKKAYYFGYALHWICYITVFGGDTFIMINKFLHLTATSSIGFCCVHLAGGQKMTETIMETKDWILLVHCLVACLEWFVIDHDVL